MAASRARHRAPSLLGEFAAVVVPVACPGCGRPDDPLCAGCTAHFAAPPAQPEVVTPLQSNLLEHAHTSLALVGPEATPWVVMARKQAEIKKEKAKSAQRHEKRKEGKDHGKSDKGGRAKPSNRRPSKNARDKAKSTK